MVLVGTWVVSPEDLDQDVVLLLVVVKRLLVFALLHMHDGQGEVRGGHGQEVQPVYRPDRCPGVRHGCPGGRFPEGTCEAPRVGAPKRGGGDATASGGEFRAIEQIWKPGGR